MDGLSDSLLEKAVGRGSRWLTDLAEKSQLVAELRPLRRLAWIKQLGLVSAESLEGWAEELQGHRKQYSQLEEEYRRETDVKAADPKLCNPLSRNADNPYLKIQVNEELLKEIWKDVERTFPECEFLSSSQSRKMLQRILFHWCRSKNPSIAASESYRQGMNELAAVLLSVMKQCEYRGSDPEALGFRLCGSRHNEADAFASFCKLMEKGLRPMFLAQGSRPARSPIGELPRSRLVVDQGPGSAILARCGFIFDQVVRSVEPDLVDHLKRLEIEPQVFLLRWIRLLFCREFDLQETHLLWDGLLASAGQSLPATLQYEGLGPAVSEAAEASRQLPLLDFLAAALLLRMRRELLRLDQTECLRRLLRSCSEDRAAELLVEAKRLTTGALSRAPAAPLKQASHVQSPPTAPAAPAARLGEANDEDPLRRGQQFISAAAQSAQGLLQAGRQAYAKLSDQAVAKSPAVQDPRGTSTGTRSPGLTQSIANWVDIDLWSDKASGPQDELSELRQRARNAEQERDEIKRKANEFITKKKAEFAAQLAERDQKIAELTAKLAEAQAALARGAEVGPVAAETEVAAATPGSSAAADSPEDSAPAAPDSAASVPSEVLEEMANDI